MMRFITHSTVAGSAIAAAFLFATPTLALESDVFLEASPSYVESSITEGIDMNLEGRSSQDENNTAYSTSSTIDDDMQEPSRWNKIRSYFESTMRTQGTIIGSFWQGIVDGSAISSSTMYKKTVSAADLARVHVKEVDATSAILSWPSSAADIQVYYASTSPVVVTETTAHASPWKFWSHRQVTLKGLSPNTTYYYKVVVVTSSGTTTSAEASFKTITR